MMADAARGVLDVAKCLLEDLDLDAVLDRVVESARQLTGARYGALGVLGESQTELSRFITSGIDERGHAAIGALPRGRGVLGELIAKPAPLRLADVSLHPHSYGFPQGHPPMHTFLGVPILIDGKPYGNLYLTEKSGGAEFSDADEDAVTMLAELAGMAIDHARRYTGANERRDELERAVATLEATTQIASAVGAETDLNVILALVAKRGRALVDARVLVIELVQGGRLLLAAGAGDLPEGLIGRSVSAGDSAAATALRTHRSQRLEEPLTRARFEAHGLGTLGVRARHGLIVPLVFQSRHYGVLVAVDRLHDGPRFGAEDERLLEAFAASAATAVATAQSVAADRRRQRLAAAEQERRRWARELHDDTLQSLSALRVGLASARRSGEVQALEDAVSGALESLDEGIANLRALISDLRPAALDELGVAAAIHGLAERSAAHGLEVDVTVELRHGQSGGDGRHPPEVETATYRIVQEALTNAAKHGDARRAVVEVREDEREIRIRVRDDGHGFDPTTQTDGLGLIGMHERVQLLDGGLRIDSAPGHGTTITASIPVMRAAVPDPEADTLAELDSAASGSAQTIPTRPRDGGAQSTAAGHEVPGSSSPTAETNGASADTSPMTEVDGAPADGSPAA